jgi:hypothetical protein
MLHILKVLSSNRVAYLLHNIIAVSSDNDLISGYDQLKINPICYVLSSLMDRSASGHDTD